MALIKCSECNKEMSDSATACPNCGKPYVKPRKISVVEWIGIFVFGGIGFLFLISNKKAPETAGVATQAAVQQEVAAPALAVEPVLKVGLKELLSSYENNEVAADNQYKGKLIEVKGVIGEVKKDILGTLYVTVGTTKELEIPQVQALFEDSANGQLAQLKKGAQITVVCRVNGLMMNVLAEKCIIK